MVDAGISWMTREIDDNGRIIRLICAICVEWVNREDLAEDSGGLWDVCKSCFESEGMGNAG